MAVDFGNFINQAVITYISSITFQLMSTRSLTQCVFYSLQGIAKTDLELIAKYGQNVG